MLQLMKEQQYPNYTILTKWELTGKFKIGDYKSLWKQFVTFDTFYSISY